MQKKCASCGESKQLDDYSDWQWRKEEDGTRTCVSCTQKKAPRSQKECASCGKSKGLDDYSDWQWRKEDEGTRTCVSCTETKSPRSHKCAKCGKLKELDDYSDWQWRKEKGRSCKECTKRGGRWTCGGCMQSKPHAEFTKCRKSYRGTKKGRCDVCEEAKAAEEATQWARSLEQVSKRQRRM